MLIESTPRKPIETRIFVNELNEVVEFIKGTLATILRFYLSLVRSAAYGKSEVKLFASKEIINR
jgi:hypothetical protein